MATITKQPVCAGRDLIIEEAEHLIHLHGFQGTSLDDIARRCKMTKANLLHHFRSKEELGLAVLDYKIACYRRNCVDQLFKPGLDPVKSVAELFHRAASFYRGNGCKAGCFVGNVTLEMSDQNDRFRGRVLGFFEDWTQKLAARLGGRGARARAESILALYEGAIMLAKAGRDAGIFERVARMAVEIAKGGGDN